MTDPVQPATTQPAADDSGIDPSKVTMIASAVAIVLPLIPGVGPALTTIMGANPHLLMSIVGAAFGAIHYGQVKGWFK